MERLRRLGALVSSERHEAFVPQIIIRSVVIVLLMAALLAGFMLVAARKADELSIARQQKLIATVLEQNFRSIAHDQEAATVWDDSVDELRKRPIDLRWLDDNLGIWFHSYYGHDEIMIVDPNDRLIYAMREGRRDDIAGAARLVRITAQPLLTELRVRMRNGLPIRRASAVLTPGAIDLGMINGHPAIVSAKPIVSDTGERPQRPGSEYIHVSIRYLDGSFIADIAGRYELGGGRFAAKLPDDPGLSRVALRTRSGSLLGYFVWEPFLPGTAMLGQVAPALGASLIIVFAIVTWLLRRIRFSTLQLSAATSRAQHLADHDPLTSLANRALFDKRLGIELARVAEGGRSLALLYVDLDHFKNVNDHFGHPTGDQLICALSRILSDIAPDDVVARLGGDEFAIIHFGDPAATSAETLARGIHRALARPIDLGDGEVLIGASIGIAVAPRDAGSPVDLVRAADIALYEAKRGGRRRHAFYTAAMGERVRDRNGIEADLREAMRTGEGLDIVYQPYFEARTGALIGAEALIRWQHADRGTMLPDQFIPIAEECGLIETLNEWVLEQACLAAARWPTGTISVNLSAVQLRNAALAERVFSILKRTRLSPARLELEITETSFLDSSEKCRSSLGWLRDVGVRIALDDFGTGYSSFKHLAGLEVDRVKIDQSFVSTIQPGKPGSPVIQAIVGLARLSGLETTAEGVETEQQRLFLTSIGCAALQGFLLARPLDMADIEARFLAAQAGA
ncbi:EAL domain-containing protein [Rhizorhabdus sp.]|jgi:diguanylate cyclase (GGDEF)-like protein|uniref:putative bifunctional diguanylate cyclase/phosphodiesterase n=1 Tax=Rhizorhabdus sp. TaxID=1968843 RepID=UPI0012277F1F|nr:EAL domain-containing protein [Rhizorhabdus sp.]MBD3761871.1 EAL domain-containing protein [Rhizorhabdus sp.]TAK11322.1 MAG: EAL domain-containing protein [Rhizorhabdus sp.]